MLLSELAKDTRRDALPRRVLRYTAAMSVEKINKKYGLIYMAPAQQMEVIQDLWHNEAAMFHDAGENDLAGRLEALEQCDALSDAWLMISKRTGAVGLLGPPDIA